MRPVWLPGLCLTLLLLIPASSARVSEATIATDSGSMADAPPKETSPCGITLRARYDTRVSMGAGLVGTDWLKLDLWNSRVRTLLGTWASLGPRCSVPKGTNFLKVNDFADFARACELDMGCNLRRRYRFLVCVPRLFHLSESCDTAVHKVWTYYPSSTGWAERGETDIDLGDLGLLFPHLVQEPEVATPDTPKAKN